MTRKTKQDWYESAYLGLKESGVEAISAEKLAKKLGVSRGSFYHHFGSRDGFHQSLLSHWLEQNTYQIKALNEGKSNHDKLAGLMDLAWSLPHEIEVAIRSWALYDPLAREYQIKNDELRLKYVQHLFEEKFEPAKAKDVSEVLYYSFIGLQNRQPMASKKEIEVFKKTLLRVLGGYLAS